MRKLLFTVLLIPLLGCAQKNINPETDSTLTKGLQLYKKGDYKRAKDILKKAIFRSEGLTPRQMMEARFALADSYYNRQEYIDAIAEFEEFAMLYPTSDKIPETLYKLADSYLKISPDYRRDLTYVKKAEEKAREIIDSYPDSRFVEGAKEILKKVNQIRARHTLYIAETYEKYGKPYSASVYYALAYEKYRDLLEADYVAYKLAYNLSRADVQYYTEINRYREKIKQLEKEINQEKDIEKKNILINRKKLLEDHVNLLVERISTSKEKALEIAQMFPKAFPDSRYLPDIKQIEKENKVENFLKRFNIFE